MIMKNNEKMMFLKNYSTNFMFLLVLVCITLLFTIWSHIIFNFPFSSKISLMFAGFMK